MKKIYVLIYSETLGSKDQIKVWLNAMGGIDTWRIDLPHAIYFVSELSANEISVKLQKITQGKPARYLITEISENSQGLLPADSWYLFKNKELKRK